MEEGDLQNGHSSGFQNAINFVEGYAVVVDMFQDVVTQYKVESIVFKRHGVDIHLDFCQRRLNIRRYILISVYFFKTWNEAGLGSNMQNGLLSFEKIGPAFEVQPDKPVPLQRKTVGAKSIWTRVETAIRQKGAESALTYGAGDAIPGQE